MSAAVMLVGGGLTFGCSSATWEPAVIPPETMKTPPVPGMENKSELDAAFDDEDDEPAAPEAAPEAPAPEAPAPEAAPEAPAPEAPAPEAPAPEAAPKKP